MADQITITRPRVFTIKRAATELGIGERTIWRAIESGSIKKIRLSERRVGIPADEVERIAANGIAA